MDLESGPLTCFDQVMSTTLIEVRPAKAADAAAVASTHDEAWRSAYQGIIPGPELDKLIAAADAATGDDRQAAFEKVFKYQNDEVVQFAHIAHQTGMLGISPSVAYEPNSSSGDELRLAEVTQAK